MVIILWVFNWICWKRKCCCLEAFDEYCNKVFSWWLSWVFLCGILACCIAGFVTANRFGFALYGVQCAYERIYYDSKYGQLKRTYPKWEGFEELNIISKNLNATISKINGNSIFSKLDFYNKSEDIKKTDELKLKENFIYPIPKILADLIIEETKINDSIKTDIENIEQYIFFKVDNYIRIRKYCELIQRNNSLYLKQLDEIQNVYDMRTSFQKYKTKFIKDFFYYVKVARAMGRILPIIYFSLLLIFVVGSGALLITYFCKKVNQQWWILPMHIAWNGIRFFMFSFFMYGCAYGMLFLFSKDSIAYLKYAFSEENLRSDAPIIIPRETKDFLNYCLLSDTTIIDKIKGNGLLDRLLIELIKFDLDKQQYPTELNSIDVKTIEKFINELIDNIKRYKSIFAEQINYFKPKIEQVGTIYANLNCSFINNSINLMYRAMWDFAWETRILCALSCCIGFFGIFAVYSFLWVMHLWRRDDINNYNMTYKKISNNNQGYSPKKNKRIRPPKDIVDDNSTELVNTNDKYNTYDSN